MPVIPSFGKFAETPNAGGSFVGGYNASSDAVNAAQALQVRQQAIAADAAQAAARIQLGRESLAQEAVQSKMELQAKQQFVQQRAMQQAQEAEIEQAYRQTQIGFKERELKNEEAIAGMRLQEAARGFDQRMSYERKRAALMDGGMGEREASEQAMREYGFGEGGFGTAVGGRGSTQPSTAERSLLYRSLQDEEKRILSKYDDPNPLTFSHADKVALRKLEERRRSMFQIQPPSAQTQGQLMPAPAMQPPQSAYMGQPRTNQIGRFKIISR